MVLVTLGEGRRLGKKKCSFGTDSALALLLGEKTTAFLSVGLLLSGNTGEETLLDGAARFGQARTWLDSAILFGGQVSAN